uniref:hypothetical protein n=1 Tax=Thaumasiovibrio occultus TaxID=1891184 RepID=UPI000B351049|nr:hypothetical protein [Thaumasiovibrio occultus]
MDTLLVSFQESTRRRGVLGTCSALLGAVILWVIALPNIQQIDFNNVRLGGQLFMAFITLFLSLGLIYVLVTAIKDIRSKAYTSIDLYQTHLVVTEPSPSCGHSYQLDYNEIIEINKVCQSEGPDSYYFVTSDDKRHRFPGLRDALKKEVVEHLTAHVPHVSVVVKEIGR